MDATIFTFIIDFMRSSRWIFALILLAALAAGLVWGLTQTASGIPVTASVQPTTAPVGSPSPLPASPQAAAPGVELATIMPAAVSTAAAEILPSATPVMPVSVLAVGDIASCRSENDEKVAGLAKNLFGDILLLGDTVYESGTAAEFQKCFNPAWGDIKDRLMPAPGNHEYRSAGAKPYYDYFGAAAGDPAQGYYSFDAGGWHIISLNSNCSALEGGCAAGSPEETWLKADLAASTATCTLAYWHHPLFSSGEHGNDREVKPLWDALYAAGADIVLNGHDHHYERFAAQAPDGTPDLAAGLVEFVVGTGGKSLRIPTRNTPNSEVREAAYGLLKLSLVENGYSWEFIPVDGGTPVDSGQGTCH